MSSQASPALGYTDFLRAQRGGNLVTRLLLQRIGAVMALAAHRLGLAPTVLTLVNVVLSVAAAAMVIAVTPAAVAGELPWWPIALAAAAVWLIAYSLDCSDGQLARATGAGSPAGARVDILCDVVSQATFVAAVAAVALAYEPQTPAWFVAVFASLWMVNLVASILSTGESAGSIVPSTHLLVELVKLVRDSGVIILLMPLTLIVAPHAMVWFMVLFTLINGMFLCASIALAARAALRG